MGMRSITELAGILGLGLALACGSGGGSPANPGPTGPPVNTVSGQVLKEGQPVAGATVTAFAANTNQIQQTVTTGTDGRYQLALPAWANATAVATFQIWVTKPGLAFQPLGSPGAVAGRADLTGQFQGNGTSDTPIYFNVLTVEARPTGADGFQPGPPITGADILAFDGKVPRIQLARSGQTVSLAPDDDAAKAKGLPWPSPRFQDGGDGTVLDRLTGLRWLKDAGALGARTWPQALNATATLSNGSAGLSDGSRAGDWRLPNLIELESLIDAGSASPALPTGHPFQGVGLGAYWTSTSYQGLFLEAWALRLADGRALNDGTSNVKATSLCGVWPVRDGGTGAIRLPATGTFQVDRAGDDASLRRGVPLPFPRWIDTGDGTLVDSLTGLVWLKQADAVRGTWSDALAAIRALGDGQAGLKDGSRPGEWRMPNRKELLSLSDRMQGNHAAFFGATFTWKGQTVPFQLPVFTNLHTTEYLWTSTTDAAAPDRAWTVYSCDFGVYDTPKTALGYSLAVRDPR